MKLKYLALFICGMFALTVSAQSDSPDPTDVPENPFGELEKLFEGFEFMDPGNGMFMDTTIIKQFGFGDAGSPEMEQMMQQMMEMMQQFDFGSMPQFDQLFEDLDLENMEPFEFYMNPDAPTDKENETKKKKRKTYRL